MHAVNISPNIEALLRAVFQHDTPEEAFAWEQNGGKYPKGFKKKKTRG